MTDADNRFVNRSRQTFPSFVFSSVDSNDTCVIDGPTSLFGIVGAGFVVFGVLTRSSF